MTVEYMLLITKLIIHKYIHKYSLDCKLDLCLWTEIMSVCLSVQKMNVSWVHRISFVQDWKQQLTNSIMCGVSVWFLPLAQFRSLTVTYTRRHCLHLSDITILRTLTFDASKVNGNLTLQPSNAPWVVSPASCLKTSPAIQSWLL